jgi:hypothetical protein
LNTPARLNSFCRPAEELPPHLDLVAAVEPLLHRAGGEVGERHLQGPPRVELGRLRLRRLHHLDADVGRLAHGRGAAHEPPPPARDLYRGADGGGVGAGDVQGRRRPPGRVAAARGVELHQHHRQEAGHHPRGHGAQERGERHRVVGPRRVEEAPAAGGQQ